MSADPFHLHPGLKDFVTPAESSFFRSFRPADFDAKMAAAGFGPDWRYSDAEREVFRKMALAGRMDQDLWVFAYGSLIWDPGIIFEEVRRAFLPGYSRRFILMDSVGGRGTRERPGLIAALDRGAGCHGLAFRIPVDRLEQETELLWRRERLLPAYVERFVSVDTKPGPATALAFAADHSAPQIVPDLPREKQVRYLATGSGELGSSLDYLRNLATHLSQMGIDDPDLSGLLTDAESFTG